VQAASTKIAPGSAKVFQLRARGSRLPFMTIPPGNLDGTEPLGFSADGETPDMRDTRGRNKTEFCATDVATEPRAKLLPGGTM